MIGTALKKRLLVSLAELQSRQSIKFAFQQEGIEREGFAAWFADQVVCFENVCRHVPITLDYGDGHFFTADQKNFVCQTHGATYEPLTGRCIAGPCAGASLKKLAIEISEGSVWLLEED